MKNVKMVLLVGLVLLVQSVSIVQSNGTTVENVIARLEFNQNKIKDMSAEVKMDITVAGKKTMQEMNLWSKDEKMKIEMVNTDRPMTVIMDTQKMSIKQAGKEPQVIDMKKVTEEKGKTVKGKVQNSITPPGMDLQKGMGEFLRKSDVSIMKEEGNKITLSVIPEESNPLMQKLDMVIDIEKGVITQQKMYSNMGVSFCKMEYEKKDNVWVLKKFTMTSNLGQMGTSTVKAEYKNVKINEGIDDEVFK